jgi:hypothetical protein
MHTIMESYQKEVVASVHPCDLGDSPAQGSTNRKEDNTMLALMIGITAALGFLVLGVGGVVLGQPASAPLAAPQGQVHHRRASR